MAASLNMSAASRYILHSGSSDVPSLWAKRIVAIRPILSWRTVSRSAAVGEACESPTPIPTVGQYESRASMFIIPSRTALEDNIPAIELEKACRES